MSGLPVWNFNNCNTFFKKWMMIQSDHIWFICDLKITGTKNEAAL